MAGSDKYTRKANFYRALSEPVRLQILDILVKKKKCICICELSDLVKKDQSVVFRHVQLLKELGIIETKKERCFLLCCINDKKKAKKYLE